MAIAAFTCTLYYELCNYYYIRCSGMGNCCIRLVWQLELKQTTSTHRPIKWLITSRTKNILKLLRYIPASSLSYMFQLVNLLQVFDTLLNGDLYPYPTYFYNITGTANYFNFLLTEVFFV